MMRMRIPNGILTSGQMRVLAEIVQLETVQDFKTRAMLTLPLGKTSNCGVRIEDIPDIFNRLLQAGMTCVQSGMDNVRTSQAHPLLALMRMN